MPFCSEIPSRPKRFGRAYTLNETDTTHSTTSQVSTDQSLTVSQTVYSSNVDTTTDETGNNITGSYTSPSSSSSTVTTLETDVNQTLTSSITQYATESGSQTDSGNEITGADSWTAGTSTTHTTRYETDSNQGLVAVSTAIDVDTDTNSGSTNDITGSYSLYETDSDPTTIYETDTQSPSYTTISTTETQNLSTTTNIGNDTTGDQTVVTSGILSSVETEHNTNGLMASTQSATTSDTSQDTNVGNTLDGSYTDTSSDSSRVTTTEWDIDSGSSDYDVETDTASTPTQVEIGNSITGGYSLAGTLTTTSTDNELDSDGGQTVSTYDNSAGTTYTLETDNSITGNSTTTTSFTNTDSLDETTLADGGDYSYINDQDSTDADYDLPGGEGGVPTVQVGNDITGAYTILAGTDTSVMTVYESDTEFFPGVDDYSSNSNDESETNTGTNVITDTTTHTGSGNDVTGGYTLVDHGTQTSVLSESHDAGADSYNPDDFGNTTQTDIASDTVTLTGNSVLQTSTETAVETDGSSAAGSGESEFDFDSQTDTGASTTTTIETNNNVSGAFATTVYSRSSSGETATDAGILSSTVGLTGSDTQATWGNDFSGGYTTSATSTDTSTNTRTTWNPAWGPNSTAFYSTETDRTSTYGTGNHFSGGYATTVTSLETTGTRESWTTANESGYGSSYTYDTVTSTETTGSTVTETGSQLTGAYTASGTGWSTAWMAESVTVGDLYSSFPSADVALTTDQTSTDDGTYNLSKSGNSLTGAYTLAHSGATDSYGYNVTIHGTEPVLTDPYLTLHETGTKTYSSTEIGDSLTSDYTLTSVGSDKFATTLKDSAGMSRGLETNTVTMTGTEGYSENYSGNHLAGDEVDVTYTATSEIFTLTARTTVDGQAVDVPGLSPYGSCPANANNGNAGYGYDNVDTFYDLTDGADEDVDPQQADGRYAFLEGFDWWEPFNAGWGEIFSADVPALGQSLGANVITSPVGDPLTVGTPGGTVGGDSEAIGPGMPGPAEMSAGAQSGQIVSGAAADAVYSQLGANALYEYCLPARATITVARGEVRIVDVIEGDMVRCVPEHDGEADAAWRPVIKTFRNGAKEVMTTRDANGREIRSTPNHKFYVRNKGFVAAEDLQPGDQLRTVDNNWVAVAETIRTGEIEPVFNICVEEYHTFFACGVLVHNESADEAGVLLQQAQAAGWTAKTANLHFWSGGYQIDQAAKTILIDNTKPDWLGVDVGRSPQELRASLNDALHDPALGLPPIVNQQGGMTMYGKIVNLAAGDGAMEQTAADFRGNREAIAREAGGDYDPHRYTREVDVKAYDSLKNIPVAGQAVQFLGGDAIRPGESEAAVRSAVSDLALSQGAGAVDGVSGALGVVGGPLHHLATDKNWISGASGGPWSPVFAKIFRKAGMTLDDAANLVRVPGHAGPHPEAYHAEIFDRLTEATKGLSGAAYKDALLKELSKLAEEAQTAGTRLNKLLTGG